MPGVGELKLESFFASRSGVCVYVTIGKRTFRIQFVDPSAHGVVVEGGREGAEEACSVARQALRKHAEGLAPLFAKVARATT
ncbi:MAG TPA: hypothetical protein VHB79_36065 [Polyangiaceae bacterium]|nr:hypothetical protein [Polyangiaceae bacterium]